MASGRKCDRRRLSRTLLAGATGVAALGVLSVRLLMAVLIGDRHAIWAAGGAVGWEWHSRGTLPAFANRWGPFILDRNDDPVAWWFESMSGPGGQVGTVGIPLWMPLAAMIAAGAWLAFQHRRRSGHCPKCDYDLAGLEPGAPCPECGRPIDRRVQAAGARVGNVPSNGGSS
jgi:hypothetical protein